MNVNDSNTLCFDGVFLCDYLIIQGIDWIYFCVAPAAKPESYFRHILEKLRGKEGAEPS